MEKWIKTYPKMFSKEECAGLIEWFEILDESKQLVHTKLEGHREFDEVNLNDFREQSLKVQSDVYKRFDDIIKKYVSIRSALGVTIDDPSVPESNQGKAVLHNFIDLI